MATLVLDTNAWLDALIFRDSRVDGLLDAARASAVRIAIDGRAVAEFERVLTYTALALDPGDATVALEALTSIATRIDIDAIPLLPRCRDPDDQMFLEIAVAAGATAILTRDDALLCLSRRMSRDHGVAIAEPMRWREFAGQMSKR